MAPRPPPPAQLPLGGLHLPGRPRPQLTRLVLLKRIASGWNGISSRALSRIASGWIGISARAVTQNRVLLRHRGMITATGVMDNESVYRSYSEELTRYATGLVGPFDAPDVVTDACLKAFDSRSWPDVVDRRAYLYRTVLTVAHDHHRRTLSRRVREMKSAPAELVPDPTASIDVEVLEAVSRLSVQQRAAVFLTYWEDLSPEAAAARMGVSVGSVKRHLARARKRLGEVLS